MSRNFFSLKKEERDYIQVEGIVCPKAQRHRKVERRATPPGSPEHGRCGWKWYEVRLDPKGPEFQEKHLGFIMIPWGATGEKSRK